MIIERSMWQQSINTSEMSIDNVWLTTIAGKRYLNTIMMIINCHMKHKKI